MAIELKFRVVTILIGETLGLRIFRSSIRDVYGEYSIARHYVFCVMRSQRLSARERPRVSEAWRGEHAIGDHAILGLVLAVLGVDEPERVHAVDLADERRMDAVAEHRLHPARARARSLRRH